MSNILAVSYDDASALTPSDSTVYTKPFAGFYVGVSGNVTVRTARGNVVTFIGCQAGVAHTIAFDKLMATNTTATSIVGLRAEPYTGTTGTGP
jgi:zona occludens toxin (predicted ATPase)